MESSQLSQDWSHYGHGQSSQELPMRPSGQARPRIASSSPPLLPHFSEADGDHNDSNYEDLDDEEWDKDTDEIRSISSEELHETRPNRWKGGHPSTYLRAIQAERDVWASLQEANGLDLGGPFTPKVDFVRRQYVDGRRVRAVPVLKRSEEEKAAFEERKRMKREKEREKREEKELTEWPVEMHKFLREDERGAKRKWILELTDGLQSRILEDKVSATILKFAKESFGKKQLSGEVKEEGDQADEQDVVLESIESGTPARSGGGRGRSRGRSRARGDTGDEESDTSSDWEITLNGPPPMTDNELAWGTLRPLTRRILQRLYDIMEKWQDVRIVRTAKWDESEADAIGKDIRIETRAEEDGPDEAYDTEIGGYTTNSPRPSMKRRGRPRNPDLDPRHPKERSQSRRGRPNKSLVPMEGETEEEMLIRVARQQKKRLPDFYFDTDFTDAETSRSASRSRSRSAVRRGKRKEDGASEMQRQPVESRDPNASSAGPSTTPAHANQKNPGHRRRKGRLHFRLRNWEDVIGAATLTGIEIGALNYTMQRALGYTDDYTVSPDGDDSYSSDYKLSLLRNRREQSRQVSVRLRTEPPSEPEMATASEGESKRRQRSATPGTPGGSFLCPHVDCPFAVTGFSRGWNLKRHLEKQHNSQRKRSRSVMETTDDDGEEEKEDDMDMMNGDVHVDGFLQPIKWRRGWKEKPGERPKRYKADERGRSKRRGSIGRGYEDDSGEDGSDEWHG